MGRRIHVRSGSGNGMTLWPHNWWPRTLSAQLIVVTITAVVISNLAVALWFETTQAILNEASLTERIADRAASAATLLSGIPAREREEAVRTMSSGPWHFELQFGPDEALPMNADEARLAARARSMLQPQRAKLPVSVSMRFGTIVANPSQGQPTPRHGSIVQLTVPVVRNEQVVVTFLRPAQ